MRRKHRELLAWQHAIGLVTEIYRLTSTFPDSERFGLTKQMRRAAISVPSNIAEGAARLGAKEFLHFLGIARGSLSEIDTQLVIAGELGYVADVAETVGMEEQINNTFGLLNGLINSLKRAATP